MDNRTTSFKIKHGALKGVEFTLTCLLVIAAGAAVMADKPYPKRKSRSRKFYKTINYLKHHDFIKERKRADEVMYVLTNRGKRRLLEARMQTAAKLWGVEVLVHYDIPERFRKLRDLLRSFLKRHGFKMRSQSCWATDRDVAQVMQEFIDDNKLNKWVEIVIDSDLFYKREGKKIKL